MAFSFLRLDGFLKRAFSDVQKITSQCYKYMERKKVSPLWKKISNWRQSTENP